MRHQHANTVDSRGCAASNVGALTMGAMMIMGLVVAARSMAVTAGRSK